MAGTEGVYLLAASEAFAAGEGKGLVSRIHCVGLEFF